MAVSIIIIALGILAFAALIGGIIAIIAVVCSQK